MLVESLIGDARVLGGLLAETEAVEVGIALLAMLASPEYFEHGTYAVSTAGGIRVASKVLREFNRNKKVVLHCLKLLVSI